VGQRRPKPKHLPAKLLAIREALGASQSQLAKALNVKITCARISEYEHGTREPNLLVLLAYSHLAEIPLERIINDDLDLF
jgi:transcriptional regulator with XRE-family HTH domain